MNANGTQQVKVNTGLTGVASSTGPSPVAH